MENLAATDVEADTATIGATGTGTGGEAPTPFIYWGTSDAVTQAASWQHSVLLGAQEGAATTTLTGLAAGTTYHYRAFVTNAGGSGWAAASGSFTTRTPQRPGVVNDSAIGVTGSSANLRGSFSNTGLEAPTVTLYYGAADGGTNPGAWDA